MRHNRLIMAVLAATSLFWAYGEETVEAEAKNVSKTPVSEEHKWSLDECVQFAMEHSPSLAKQRLNVMNQKLQTIIEDAAFDWTLGADGDYDHGDRSSINHSVTLSKKLDSGFSVKTGMSGTRYNGDGYTSSALSVQISKQLLGGGSTLETRYNLEASMLDELTVQNTLEREKRRLRLDVMLKYYTIIRAQQSLTVKERALENAKRTLLITREREKPLDILTAEQRIPSNELAVNTAQRTIKNGLDDLKELIGYDVLQPLDINGDFDYKVVGISYDADLNFAVENLESLLNNRLEQKKYRMQMDIRDKATMPDVSVSGAFIQNGDGNGYNLDGDDEERVGVSVSWTLGRRADLARHEMAVNNYRKNEQDYIILYQELLAGMKNYERQLNEYAEAVRIQELECELLRRKEELYRDRWENGEIDILELVRTQTDLEDSQVELISKKVSYMELLANYLYMIGK